MSRIPKGRTLSDRESRVAYAQGSTQYIDKWTKAVIETALRGKGGVPLNRRQRRILKKQK